MMILQRGIKVLTTYDVIALTIQCVLILCCDNVSNGFTVTTTTNSILPAGRSTLQHQRRYYHRSNGSHHIPSSSSSFLTELYGSINFNSRFLSNQNRTFKKKKTKKTNTVSDFLEDQNIINEEDNDSDDDMEQEGEEYIEFAMDNDDDEVTRSSSSSSDVTFPKDIEELLVESKPSTSSSIPPSSSSSSSSTDHTSNAINSSRKVKVQYCALEPGTVIQIEVGDISRARKAWKKRRRSDSPLLIPCSILNVNRRSSIRYNCIYLLEKFGTSITTATATSTSSSNNNHPSTNINGMSISLTELSVRYRTHLKSSLLYHATQLGYSNSYELITNIFHPSVQDAYGVQLVTSAADNYEHDETMDQNDNVSKHQQQLYLQTPLSRTRAHSRAANAAILQFTESDATTDTLDHTGLVRIKKQQPRQQQQQQQNVLELTTEEALRNAETVEQTKLDASKSTNLYSLVPLSVALRVSSEDVLENLVYTGSRHAAVVFDYDVTGDANILPLITLSLNPQRNQVRDRYKQKNNSNKSLRRTPSKKESTSFTTTTKWFHELKIGDGPYTGKIVRLVKGGAIIDCNVYRPRRKEQQHNAEAVESSNVNSNYDRNPASNGKDIPVLGVLRFKDAILSESALSTTFDDVDAANTIDDDDDEDDSDWNNIFSIDELNNFDEDDDDSDDDNDLSDENNDDLEDMDDDDVEEEDDDEGEVLAAFNLDNDDEFAEGEDITHLFNIRDDGTLEYTDPETGITQIIADVNIQDEHDGDDDDDDEEVDDLDDDNILHADLDFSNDDAEDDDNDGPVLLSTFDKASGSVRRTYTDTSKPKYRTQTLRVGDTVQVFMKSISKQSNQLFLSMDASIQGKKAKDMKKENDVSKKMNRLIKQLGGYQRLRELNGTICNGTIKAISNTGGDWYYVQPDIVNIPVGIATSVSLGNREDNGTDATNESIWNVGDIVRIQLNGIDPDRGQLAMNIIDSADEP